MNLRRAVATVGLGLLLGPFATVQTQTPGSTCALETHLITPDECSGTCPPGQECVELATRPYGFVIKVGTQAAACGCLGSPEANLVKPRPLPITTFALVVIFVVVTLVVLAIALLAWLLYRALRFLVRKILELLFCYPELVSFTARRSRVVIYKGRDDKCRLSFGMIPGPPGIIFEAIVDVPRGCEGTLEFVQDVDSFRTRAPGDKPPSLRDCRDTMGRVLDSADPYGSKKVGPGRQVITASDSPSTILSPSDIKTVNEKFRMFLMWRPDKYGGAIRLPIARIDWWWRGEARFTEDPDEADCSEDSGKMWKLVSSPVAHGHSPAVRTIRFPVTSPNFDDVDFEPC